MKFILHIGRPKTGTSSLQSFLRRNSKLLATRGLNYIAYRDGADANPIFSDLSRKRIRLNGTAWKHRKVQVAREIIFREACADTGVTNLLSAESLSNVSPEVVAEVFQGTRCKLVSYVRNELEFLASSYAQHIQSGWATTSARDYLSGRKRVSNRYHLEAFSGQFSTDFMPVLFSRGNLIDGSIIADFTTRVLRIDLMNEATLPKDANPSISDDVVKFKKWLVANGREEYRGRKPYHALATLSSLYGSKYILPDTTRELLLPRIEPFGEDWMRRFFPGIDPFPYADYPFAASSEREPDYGQMLESFREILERR